MPKTRAGKVVVRSGLPFLFFASRTFFIPVLKFSIAASSEETSVLFASRAIFARACEQNRPGYYGARPRAAEDKNRGAALGGGSEKSFFSFISRVSRCI